MKICIFSDIHGNDGAFRKMYDRERPRTDCMIFAGDIFGYFYGQTQIIDRLMQDSAIYAILGNHDYNYLHTVPGSPEHTDLVNRYGSSYRLSLPERQMEYLTRLPTHLALTLGGKRFAVFHGGSGDHLNQRIYPDTPLEAGQLPAECAECDYMIVGHTHYRYLRRWGTVTVINPGSLGQPRDGKGFGYCVLDTADDSCLFRTVETDVRPLLTAASQKDPGSKFYSYISQKYQDLTEGGLR